MMAAFLIIIGYTRLVCVIILLCLINSISTINHDKGLVVIYKLSHIVVSQEFLKVWYLPFFVSSLR